MLVLAIMAAAQVARAQEPVVANIPFDFTAGNQTLPAGEYLVGKLSMNTPVLVIQRTDRSAQILAPSIPARSSEPQSDSKLVFNKYGNRYFLSQVWSAGYSSGRQLMKSSAEKELTLSARLEAPSQVILVAHLVSPRQ